MSRLSHYGTIFLYYTPFAFVLTFLGYVFTAFLGVILVSLLVQIPDLERQIPHLKYRGLTHTVWFALLVGLATAFVCSLSSGNHGGLLSLLFAGGGFLLGSGAIGAHLAVDLLSPAGITPFAPFSSRTYSYQLARANNPFLNYFCLLIGGSTLSGAFLLGITV